MIDVRVIERIRLFELLLIFWTKSSKLSNSELRNQDSNFKSLDLMEPSNCLNFLDRTLEFSFPDPIIA